VLGGSLIFFWLIASSSDILKTLEIKDFGSFLEFFQNQRTSGSGGFF
jgi:hypothetical protein